MELDGTSRTTDQEQERIMRYQFQIDGRAAGPVREDWEQAANDAIQEGYAVWRDHFSIKLSDEANIARIHE